MWMFASWVTHQWEMQFVFSYCLNSPYFIWKKVTLIPCLFIKICKVWLRRLLSTTNKSWKSMISKIKFWNLRDCRLKSKRSSKSIKERKHSWEPVELKMYWDYMSKHKLKTKLRPSQLRSVNWLQKIPS